MSDDCIKPAPTAVQTVDADILLVNDKLADSGVPGGNDVAGQASGADILRPSDNSVETTDPSRAVISTEPAGTVVPTPNDVPESIGLGRAEAAIDIPETEILPGEDPGEFHRLYQRLIEQWEPSGPIEADAVLTLAIDLWRKRRFRR
jgi:hypothetical protein